MKAFDIIRHITTAGLTNVDFTEYRTDPAAPTEAYFAAELEAGEIIYPAEYVVFWNDAGPNAAPDFVLESPDGQRLFGYRIE